MEPTPKVPTMEELKSFLEGYGWKYKEQTNPEGMQYIIAPYTLESEPKGVWVSFKIAGEFIMIATVGFLKNVPGSDCQKLLEINDKLKLVKLFSISTNPEGSSNVELGFELWNESWNKETFYAFMDMLTLGIETTLKKVVEQNITHETSFVTYT